MSSWTLATEHMLAPYTPTFVANGYLGITGDWLGLGTGDCHIADLFNRSSDLADTVRARLPAFNGLDLHNGLRWLGGVDRNTSLVQSYHQELDLGAATLTTRFHWHDGDRDIDVETNLFAARHDPQLVVQRLMLTTHFAGRVQLQAFADEGRGDVHVDRTEYSPLVAPSPHQAELGWVQIVAPTQRDRSLAIAAALRFEGPAARWHNTPIKANGRSGVRLSFRAAAGATYTLTRYVVVGAGDSEAARAQAHRARGAGYAGLLAAHTAAWEELWQGAITIEGDEQAQQVARAAQYVVLSSLRAGSGWSIAPMGLSSRGYGGHIFWDADTWIYPGVLLTHPELAQGCVDYRCDRLDAAGAKAHQYGYAGAMFPWEGDDLGVETTPAWAPCGRYEQHVTACVALAAWQWWQVTGDRAWLCERGWPLLRACADFWVSRVTPTPRPERDDPGLTYHIRDVQAADEYAVHVDDNAWTNASAARCLQIATQAAALLGEHAPPEWAHVARRMYLPFDEERQITLEYAGYTDEIIKQADVVLLSFPLEWPLPAHVAANNARYYAGRVDADHGPAMTYAIHAILAAAAGDQELLNVYLRRSYEHNLRPPFLSFSETPDQEYCTFVTGAGGLLQALLYGCCGARITDEGLDFSHAPLLPTGWTRLCVRLRCRGQQYQVVVTPEGRTVVGGP
jgi:trehalose/maltose hydrolase-like predicted phosphorylase